METGTEAIAGRKMTRRYRTREERSQIVEETLCGGKSVAMVAQEHGINANQLFHWRKLYQAGLLGEPSSNTEGTGVRLLPVLVNDEATQEEAPARKSTEGSRGTIQIEFPGRAVVRVVGSADLTAIRAVLESLRG
jgi:transposase